MLFPVLKVSITEVLIPKRDSTMLRNLTEWLTPASLLDGTRDTLRQ